MSNRIPENLELLHDMINEAIGVPLGKDRCVIDRGKALELLDDIKAQFPTELTEARRLLEARTEFINNSKREAKSLMDTAEKRAKQLINEQEVMRVARAKSNEMLSNAEKSSAELRRVANEYVDDMMKRLEETLSMSLDEIRQTRVKLHQAARATQQPQPQALTPPPPGYDDEDDDDYDDE
jgi:cell division septum initiation protein DivIVA